jgi:hypothetical protein
MNLFGEPPLNGVQLGGGCDEWSIRYDERLVIL